NYTIGYSNGTLTVGSASLLVQALDTNKVYGAVLTFAGTEFIVDGLRNTDTVTNVSLTSAGTSAGAPIDSYPITASAAQGVGLTNYAISYAEGTLTVVFELRIISVTVTNGIATVTWTSLPGDRYRLQYRNGLSDLLWKDVLPDVTSTGLVTVTTNATDGNPARFYRVKLLTETNVAPQLPSQGGRLIAEMTSFTVTNTASDGNAEDTLLYTLTGPAGATMSGDGIITWTPDEAQGPSTNTFTTVVVDNGGMKATNTFTVTVTEVNLPAVLPVQSDRIVNELTLLMVTNTASDPDLPSNGLSYTLLDPPAGATISDAGVITWMPTEAQGPSTNTLRTVVTDTGAPSLSTTNSFTVVVLEVNAVPLAQNDNYVLDGIASLNVSSPGVLANDSDADGPALQAVLAGGPAHGSLSLNANGAFTYTPTGGYNGMDAFTYRVSDGLTSSTPATVTLLVTNYFRVLSVAVTNGVATVSWTSLPGNRYRLQYRDGLSDLLWKDVLPDVTATGLVTVMTNGTDWNPARFYRVKQLAGTNVAPQLPGQGNRTIFEMTTLTVTNTATDGNVEDTLLYTLTGPAGATISPEGIIRWSPTEVQGPSTNTFTTVVTDNGGLKATNAFQVTVIEVNEAPVADDDNYTLGTASTLTVSDPGLLANDSDPDGGALSVVIVSPPSQGVLVLATNGGFSYTLTNHFSGVDTFTYRATDGQTNSGLATVSITVSNRLQITSILVSNGVARLEWTSIAGQIYELQYQDDLDGTNWASASLGITATGPTTSATNVLGAVTRRFYRVLLLTTLANPVITSVLVTNGVAVVEWPSVPGRIYQLQYQDTMGGSQWTSVSPGITATGPTTSMTDAAGGNDQRLYRVQLLLAVPAPEIQSIVVGSGLATVTWTAVVGQDYRIEYKDSVSDASWTSAPSVVRASVTLTSATDAVGTLPWRVYRVVHVAPN
ncbi:MAG: tandem-95 repeat protein, partial [Verrucomicrobia bacterium]|nr:tandem-95 repeat protein [Verrucomicrobiota bacterium]